MATSGDAADGGGDNDSRRTARDGSNPSALEPAVQGTAAEVSNVGAQPVLRSSPRLLRQRHNRPPPVPTKKVPAKRKMPDSAAADAPSSRRTRQSNASFRPEDDPDDEDDDSEDDDDFVVEDVQAGKGSSKRVKSSGAGSSRGPSTSVPAGGGTAAGAAKPNKKQVNRSPVCRCTPAIFRSMVAALKEPMRTIISDMGFTGLLEFKPEKLKKRDLLVWLMDRMNAETMKLEIGGGKSLKVDEKAVRCVLGLPSTGTEDPPNPNDPDASVARKNLAALLFDGNVKNLLPMKIAEKIKGSEQFDTDFGVRLFFMVAFCTILFCNSDAYLRIGDVKWAESLDLIRRIDWAKAVVDNLRDAVRLWKIERTTKEKPVLCGCGIFLMIYYLDNLQFDSGLDPLLTPRITQYDAKLIDTIATADQRGDGSRDTRYGHLRLKKVTATCYQDVGHVVPEPHVGVQPQPQPNPQQPPPVQQPPQQQPHPQVPLPVPSWNYPSLRNTFGAIVSELTSRGKKKQVDDIMKKFDDDAETAQGHMRTAHAHVRMANETMETAHRVAYQGLSQILSDIKAENDKAKKARKAGRTLRIRTSPDVAQQSAQQAPGDTGHAGSESHPSHAEQGYTEDPAGMDVVVRRTEPVAAGTVAGSAGVPHTGVDCEQDADGSDVPASPRSVEQLSLPPCVEDTVPGTTGPISPAGSGGPRDLLQNISAVDEVCSWLCPPADDDSRDDTVNKDKGTTSTVVDKAAEEEAAKRKEAEDAAKKREEEEAAKKNEEAAKKREQEEEASEKRKEEEEAAKKRMEEEAAKKKKEEEEAVKKRKEDEEAAKKRKEDEEAMKKKQQEEEAAMKKKQQDEVAAAARLKKEEANRKRRETLKRKKEEADKKKKEDEDKKKKKGAAGKTKKLTKTELQVLKYKEESKKLAEEAATAKSTGMSDPLLAPDKEDGKEDKGAEKEPPFVLPEVDDTQLSHDSDDTLNLTPPVRLPDEDSQNYSTVVQMQELNRKVFRMLGDRLARRPSEYVSPFKCKGQRPQIPPAKAVALRRRLQNDTSLSQLNLILFGFDVMLNGQDLLSNFNDGCMVENALVTYLFACLRHDDVVHRPEAVGYRIFISPDFWLCMRDLSKADKDSPIFQKAVEVLKDDFDNVDLNKAKLIFMPLLNGEHWTLYCFNMEHVRIDVLDSADWDGKGTPQINHHRNVFEHKLPIVFDALHEATGGWKKLKAMRKWKTPFFPCPLQTLNNDCLFLVWKFAESFNGECFVEPIEGRKGSLYRCELLHYLLFHPLNHSREIPDSLDVYRVGGRRPALV